MTILTQQQLTGRLGVSRRPMLPSRYGQYIVIRLGVFTDMLAMLSLMRKLNISSNTDRKCGSHGITYVLCSVSHPQPQRSLGLHAPQP